MRAVAWLWDLLFPPKCAFCGRVLEESGTGICPGCRDALPVTGDGYRRKADFLQTVVAPLYYEGAVRRSLLRYKFQGVSSLAEAYGPLVAGKVAGFPDLAFDRITWVPLSRRRERRRGYDQARLLAEVVARSLEREAEPLLEKVRDVPPQSGAGSPEKRRANISGCYRVRRPDRVAGARILLVDDIVTTGATMSECARALMLAGAEAVVGAALACGRE